MVTYNHEIFNYSKLIDYAVTVVMNRSNCKQIGNDKSKHINGDERGSQDALQISHGQNFTLVCFIVEPSTDIYKPKGSLEAYPSIR